MGKRKRPAAHASPLLWATPEPFECWQCRLPDQNETSSAGAHIDLWSCMGIWVCQACCEALVEASTPPKHSRVHWQRFPTCSRCEAQVPGYASLGTMDQDEDEPAHQIWLCHQCCVTMARHSVLNRLQELAESHGREER
jgi:hypothetical protein